MSVREEEQKKNCPSRGLGLAAAAIGVGVGAALYYFFNKRNEDPDSEGSTSQEWTCEHQQTLHESRRKMYKSPKNQIEDLLTPEPNNYNNNNIDKTPNFNNTTQSAKSYVTISENTTTDTSMIETDLTDALENNASVVSAITIDSSDHYDSDSDSDEYFTDDQDEITDDSELENDSIYTQSDEFNEIDEQSNGGSESFYTDDESGSTNDDDEYFTDEMSPSSSYESDSDIDISNAPNASINSINTTRNLSFESDSSNTPNNTNNATGTTRNSSKYQMPLIRMNTNESEADISGWEVTETASGVPELGNNLTPGRPYVLVSGSDGRRSPLERLFRSIKERFDIRYVDTNRERSWSLEECAICFEIMLKDQPLMSLPCTHNFHVQCIGPWLQEKHTCPVCRKAAE